MKRMVFYYIFVVFYVIIFYFIFITVLINSYSTFVFI